MQVINQFQAIAVNCNEFQCLQSNLQSIAGSQLQVQNWDNIGHIRIKVFTYIDLSGKILLKVSFQYLQS